MSKNILTIGFELASDNSEYVGFHAKLSLLDWDIILFKPEISDFYAHDSYYQGKPSLKENSSFVLKECCEHWRREIKQAVEAGKTVVIFLPSVEEVYIDTGERRHSGTGRNQTTTRIVTLYKNYAAIPVDLKPVNTTGSAMKLVPLGAEILAPYWAEFGSISEYKVLLGSDTPGICLTTRNGNKPVGAISRSKNSAGSLVMLPDINFEDELITEDKDGEIVWTSDALKFTARLLNSIVALDKALRSTTEVTPAPGWATSPSYVLAQERELITKLLDAEQKVEEAQRVKEALQESLDGAGKVRALLFEKGKPLEFAIIEALRMLGFNASQYKEADSEFDVVFSCAEGRLLGEAEGKDSKAVNVDKLRQLAMNIHEDLQREEVTKPAKGVLFGNGYRLVSPSDRATQFTEKCIAAAQSSSTALVATSTLFTAVQYLAEEPDAAYAKKCREIILNGTGLVSFPTPPEATTEGATETTDTDV